MTQWKVGDKAEVIVAVDNLRIGDQVEVVSLDENGFPIFNTDKDHEMGWESVDEYYKKVTNNIYETIQINGKLYNLVPVEE